jgi:hypothetical protein
MVGPLATVTGFWSQGPGGIVGPLATIVAPAGTDVPAPAAGSQFDAPRMPIASTKTQVRTLTEILLQTKRCIEDSSVEFEDLRHFARLTRALDSAAACRASSPTIQLYGLAQIYNGLGCVGIRKFTTNRPSL